MSKVGFSFIILSVLMSFGLQAQKVNIEMGRNDIALNQLFTITLEVQNARLQSYSGFPEISGFQKRGTSSSSSTNFINGVRSSTQSITQNYLPTAEGTFKVAPFTIRVNGEDVRSEGTTVRVGPAIQQQSRRQDPFGDPFQDFFGQRNQAQPQEFVNIEADAFLALTTDKSAVYPGEGFTMTLAFYVSQNNRAEMRFHQLGEQLEKIIKKIKPANCWEENFNIESISGEPVTINGEQFNQFKIYQATYYPLNNDPIEIPKIGLELIKYQIAKNRTFFGQNKKEELVKFYSKPKTVTIKEMPEHPLKESVSVGNYKLEEKISDRSVHTGNSFNYEFSIVGEGNISGINELQLKSDENFDLFPPNTKQSINRNNGKVRGRKSFSFYGIPNEPGTFDMGDYFSWIYFNTRTEKYDTLKSDVTLVVTGESKKNESILSNDMGSFYDAMDIENNKLVSLDSRKNLRTVINVIIFAMIGLVVALMFKK
ncbi:Oxygen tolerance [Reichenbachiella agariperforans]|uniref:Oxygen tolerance n=1 Tax=Reichenbachiella agariperforans TaxID=156994 RepID=A0A1M6NGP1_REIAG|nr:BatD family protein [Reichenbachiella agariperforans]SHJ94786.1 Oxygen tolerance [Reichenbachiella agariperforans]